MRRGKLIEVGSTVVFLGVFVVGAATIAVDKHHKDSHAYTVVLAPHSDVRLIASTYSDNAKVITDSSAPSPAFQASLTDDKAQELQSNDSVKYIERDVHPKSHHGWFDTLVETLSVEPPRW